jgi:hypothetical protein
MLDSFRIEHALFILQGVALFVALHTSSAIAKLDAEVSKRLNQHVVDFHVRGKETH